MARASKKGQRCSQYEQKTTYRSTHGFHCVACREVLGEAEIDHFDARGVLYAGQHKVFGLDVSVTDLLVVEVRQRGQELMHDHGCLALGQMLALQNEVEELAALAVPTSDNGSGEFKKDLGDSERLTQAPGSKRRSTPRSRAVL